MHEYQGIFGIIILALDILAIINVITSNRDIMPKVLWTLLIVLLPIIGFIVWLIFGPRSHKPKNMQ